ncbi:hypothetical protein C0989_001719 [Termitomyces sp. Mn162]|nr:hypothetical protein C0989_001719 [Termitomyces sp. Mn162]
MHVNLVNRFLLLILGSRILCEGKQSLTITPPSIVIILIATAAPSPTPINTRALDIEIIGAVPFAHILQDGTPTFQLQITPALPEEYLCAETTLPEQKTEEQILHEVVPPEYHEFADVFSEGSAKELSPHCSYNHKIDLE